MQTILSRRDALKLAAIGGVVFASRLALPARAEEDFYFVQISDTHWGFEDPKVNPDPRHTLLQTIDAVNSVATPPDFIVFTGDLTHKTEDAAERHRRMNEVNAMIGGLKVQKIYFLPGEHDAAADQGAAFKEVFGVTHQSFDHKGVHFITLDNVSDPNGRIGEEQLDWLEKDLSGLPAEQPVVLFTHRPIFDLKRDWDWFTEDGSMAVAMLNRFQSATVFYGHIHQQNRYLTGNVVHLSARSALYPLPAPGSRPKKAPLPWDAAAKDHGIGWREIEANGLRLEIQEHATA
ncbi:MAG TPA: metallophosphoesterase [Dongiaceae bacterium]|jgi:3',5'-cyclic AMP phosphodiesterase CpdA|nr:metallophosphoesterase [Dongiaceae bacterium]